MAESGITRRDVLKSAAVAAAAVAGAQLVGLADEPATQPAAPGPGAMTRPAPMIGIQTGIPPLATGDIDAVLDDMQKRGGVNTLFPFIYTYAHVTAAMKAKGFHGGNFAIPHMQYYKNTTLTYADMRAPDFGDLDVLDRTITAAKKHGMKTFAWVLEDHDKAPSEAWHPLYEIDFHGNRVLNHPSGPCYNNPAYLGFVLGLIEDYTRSYDIDGVMWSSERQGGFLNAIGAYAHGSSSNPANGTCFCQYCQARAKSTGIDPQRAIEGFTVLQQYVANGRAGQRPRDGYFVEFFRILFNYPELLAWETLWQNSREDLMKNIYKLVKSIKPDIPVGWHIWHNVTFSPFHRAEMDYARMVPYSDYLKPVLYDNAAGERMHAFTEGICQNVLGDLPPDMALQVLYGFQDFKEAPFDKLEQTGFSADYVRRETARCVDDVRGTNVQVWPGVGIDVPVPPGCATSTPEKVKQAVMAAFQGGAPGVLLSRNYPEMNPEHLSGAGAALDELGLR
jgi:hypothetical protein